MKITAAQLTVLLALYEKDGRTSYELRAGLQTLDALARRDLAHSRHDRGELFAPSTSIKWFITTAGREEAKKHIV